MDSESLVYRTVSLRDKDTGITITRNETIPRSCNHTEREDFVQKHNSQYFYKEYSRRPLLCVGVWGGFYKQVSLMLNCMLGDFHHDGGTAKGVCDTA